MADQPFIPLYFPFDVEVNRKGAAPLIESISKIEVTQSNGKEHLEELPNNTWVVDTRKAEEFKDGHLPHSINLMEDGKYETWLGTIIKPEEKFLLAGKSKGQLQKMMERTAAIGYEKYIDKAVIVKNAKIMEPELDVNLFKKHMDDYTILDVRNTSEVKEGKIFEDSISIPLSEIRNKVNEIPTDKPIVVHCAGGYRSAAASSIISSELQGKVNVFDLGENVKQFIK